MFNTTSPPSILSQPHHLKYSQYGQLVAVYIRDANGQWVAVPPPDQMPDMIRAYAIPDDLPQSFWD